MRVLRPPAHGAEVMHGDTIEALRLGWEVLGGLAMLLSAVLAWSMRAVLRQMVSKEELQRHVEDHVEEHKDLDKQLGDGEVRFARIEEQLKHLPQRSDIEGLTRSVAAVANSVAEIAGKIQGVNDSVNALRNTVNMLVKNELEG